MKKLKKSLCTLMAAGALALTSCGDATLNLPELPLAEVKPYFSQAAATQAIDTAFYEIKDAQGQVLGTVLFSSPYSDNVKGYNGTTPLLITLDPNGLISNVVLLANQETPFYANRVVDGRLYEAWNGLSVEEAIEKQVDAVSGATYTSNGVKNSLVARLKAYQRQAQKDRNNEKGFWQRLFG